jgi:hypothetical protein
MEERRVLSLIVLYITISIISTCTTSAQVKSIGLPDVQNFTTAETFAGNQTWDIIEDANGNVYFGNNAGIVKFDGEAWEIIPNLQRIHCKVIDNGVKREDLCRGLH